VDLERPKLTHDGREAPQRRPVEPISELEALVQRGSTPALNPLRLQAAPHPEQHARGEHYRRDQHE
jgi:hypothetical protein